MLGFLVGLPGVRVLLGGGRRADTLSHILNKAVVASALFPVHLWEPISLQVALFVCAYEVAVRGKPGPVDGAVSPQLLPILGVPQVCKGEGRV